MKNLIITQEEFNKYEDIRNRIEEWLKLFLRKMSEKEMLPKNSFFEKFSTLYSNLYLYYGYRLSDELEHAAITIPLHVIYEDRMDWFIDKMEKEKEQEKLEQEKEKFEHEKKEAINTIIKLKEKYNL